MKDIIVVAGPTASGKTKLAVSLAQKYNGEVISADSMQIYKYMNIGTAKPMEEEMQSIPHYMIDIVSPLETFNVVKYQEMAFKYIEDIFSRGKVPVICGGTGLYINSLIYNISYAETDTDEILRSQLEREAELYGKEYLYNKLVEIDPKAAGKMHMNNVKRVIRALEVYENTGKRFSEFVEESQKSPSIYNFICIYLDVERSFLYERINMRVDEMVNNGLIEETEKLYNEGLLDGMTASAGICYKEMIPCINSPELLEQCKERLKQSTRNYAKRQITWFGKMDIMNRITVTKNTSFNDILNEASDRILKFHT